MNVTATAATAPCGVSEHIDDLFKDELRHTGSAPSAKSVGIERPRESADRAVSAGAAPHQALHRAARRSGARGAYRLEIDIHVPAGRTSLSDYEIRFAVLRSVLGRRGVNASRAALEELMPRFKFQENERPLLRRVNYGGIIKGAYLIKLSFETEAQVFALRTEAEKITAAKTPPVHGSTSTQRYERAFEIALDKYIQPALTSEVKQLATPANLGMIVGLSTAMIAAEGTPIGWGLTAAGALALGAEGVEALTDFKNFVMYAGFAEKPSDLDRAARSLAQVIARVGANGLSTIISGNAIKLNRGGR